MMISTTELSMANAVAHGGFVEGSVYALYCENCGNRYFRILEMREKSGTGTRMLSLRKRTSCGASGADRNRWSMS